jgi:NAD+ kinase
MSLRIALFGGSFNPPGLHHRTLAQVLAERFDRVIVIPCGPRPDKQETNAVPPVYRAALADITFGDLARVEVDLFDLESDQFTRSADLEARYRDRGEVWLVVGTDLIKGGATGMAEIQRSWDRGSRLWEHGHFIVLERPGHECARADLPPQAEVIAVDIPGASRDIRSAMERGADVSHLVTERALNYMQRYGLYRVPVPNSKARGSLTNLQGYVQADAKNPVAMNLAAQFQQQSVAEVASAHFITALGGDGLMLRAIREHWRQRLPFYGVNAGHLGFLMNDPRTVNEGVFPPADVIFHQLPMLYVEIELEDGSTQSAYGFNDAWLERTTSLSAWLQVKVNGVTRLEKLVCDGALVSTAAGSTAYARSMGAPPLLADTSAWLVVGSNVMEPFNWKSALLSVDSSVEIRCLNPERRPVEAYVDGHCIGLAVAMRARLSRAAAAELVYHASHDMAEKIAAVQFGHDSQLPGPARMIH